MTKRIVAGTLWFFAGWYLGAFVAEFLGLSPLLGPVWGTSVAALIMWDPRRVIWATSDRAASPKAESQPVAETSPAA
jgi:hypothetical protein